MKHKLLSVAVFSLVPFVAYTEAKALGFSQAYVFGDSLSDPGNIFNATQAVQPFTEEVLGIDIPITPPVPPYDSDGRFADGLVWIDFLAAELELDLIPSTELTPSPITLFPEPSINFNFNGATADNSVNFAFGGAQTGFSGAGETGALIPGILTQVNGFAADLLQANNLANQDALYIVWGGANDYQIIPEASPEASVKNLTQAVETLYSVGARNFLLPKLPDLGQTPRGLSPNPLIGAGVLTERTNEHNRLLDAALAELNLLPDVELVSFDTNALFEPILANPEDFGFAELVSEPCLQGDPLTVGIADLSPCDNPDERFFWDSIHPSSATHKLIGNFALNALQSHFQTTSSVPEPKSLLALGLITIAWFWSLRKKIK